MHYNHLFGPVQSRRLGVSLGVDLIPFKTCNCNCVYCECGGAKVVPHERHEYIPAKSLIAELDHYLATRPSLDYVTFAGSGEPTLNSALGTVLRFVNDRFPDCRTALLTNGTLFHMAEVREEAMPFDLILPSIDAASEEVFNIVNRPYPGLTARQIIDGLATFSHVYRGQIWVEVFIVPGINDTPEELIRLKDALQKIRFARVQLNSLDRPGACEWVKTASADSLSEIADFLKPLPVEIISRSAGNTLSTPPQYENLSATIEHQLLRRPATLEEIAVLCSVTINAVNPILKDLVAENRIEKSVVNGREFFAVTSK